MKKITIKNIYNQFPYFDIQLILANCTFQITEAGKMTLPHWLVYHKGKQLLQGIPSTSDLGQHYIEVVAVGEDGSQAKDTFSIFVIDDAGAMPGTALKFKSRGPKPVRCKRSEPETTVSIVIDANLNDLHAKQRLNLLSKFMSHLDLAEDMLKLVPVGNKAIQDSSALVSGTGDVKEVKTGGTFVSWLVGCGKVEADHMQALQQVETDSSNGELAVAVGYPVFIWQVTNSRFQVVKRHKRRAVRPTPTPAMTLTPPTKGPKDTLTDDMTRPVATLESPTFSIHPTQVQTGMEKTDEPRLPDGKPDKPDMGVIQPSVPVPKGGEATKTDALPTRTYEMTDKTKPTKATLEPTEPTSEPTDIPKIRPIDPNCKDLKPNLKHPIRNLEFTAGDVMRFKIPEHTFYDCRVGNTRKLRLSLFGNKTDVISKSFWLQFDRKKQAFMGLPTDKNVGKHMFTLIALNAREGDRPASDRFNIIIKANPDAATGKINHELSMTIDYDYDDFQSNVHDRISFMNKVGRMYGDKNAKKLTLTGMKKGSTIVSWTNNTLASPSACPVEDIKNMVSRLVNDDGTLTDEAQQAMKPFKLTQAGAEPKGACENNPNFPRVRSIPLVTSEPESKPEPETSPEPEAEVTTEAVAKGSTTSDDDIWITTIVPAVAVVVILLLALLIACILYRKKRKGKMTLEDQNTFIKKGVPVIFQDELEEKPDSSAKPLLMEGEPPCPPPEYTREGSTPPPGQKENLPVLEATEAELDETSVTSPLYQPPPPVASSGANRHPRPHVQPAYRSQPPSIPP